MLEKSHPVLASLDIASSVQFYENRLGFTSTWKDDHYGIVVRDAIAIHFWRCDDRIFPENTSCYIEVSDVDTLYAEMQKADVIHPNGTLVDQPWHMREFSILDLYGNLIRFGQPIS